MSTATNTHDTDLPIFPGERAARCPFNPPAEYTQWREQDGLRPVRWHGHTVWAVSRYEDIKAAMTDPRISANTLGVLQGNGNHEGPDASRAWTTRSTPGCAACSPRTSPSSASTPCLVSIVPIIGEAMRKRHGRNDAATRARTSEAGEAI